jgi:DNA primase
VFNYDNAIQHDEVIVVEGVKKALKFPNAVATWGTGISNPQMQIIQQWDRIVMMLDGEEHNGTQQRAKEFVEGLKTAGKKAINIDLRSYGVTSPDDLPAETLQNIVREEWCEQYA